MYIILIKTYKRLSIDRSIWSESPKILTPERTSPSPPNLASTPISRCRSSVCPVDLQLLQPHQMPPLSLTETILLLSTPIASYAAFPCLSSQSAPQPPAPRRFLGFQAPPSAPAVFGHVLTAPAPPSPRALWPRAPAVRCAPACPLRAPPPSQQAASRTPRLYRPGAAPTGNWPGTSPPARPGDRRGGSSGMRLSPAAERECRRLLPRFPRPRLRPPRKPRVEGRMTPSLLLDFRLGPSRVAAGGGLLLTKPPRLGLEPSGVALQAPAGRWTPRKVTVVSFTSPSRRYLFIVRNAC